jgi:PAS domain S-box-containing protein
VVSAENLSSDIDNSKMDSDSNPAYWEIAERLLDGFYRVDLAGVIIIVSPKAVATIGYDNAEQMIGKVSMADLWVNPKERDVLLAELREHGEVRAFETTLIQRDGGHIRVELSVVPVFDNNGNHIANDGVVRDVTERSRSEQQFRSLIRNSPGALFHFVADDNPRYTYMSDAIEDITGYPPEYFLENQPALQPIIHPEDLEGTQALQNVDIQPGEQYSLELRIIRPDGEVRWIQLQGSGSTDPITGASFADGVILDVTDDHLLAHELAERERQLQSLIQNVPGAIYRFAENNDGEWRFAYMSPAITAITGHPPEFFIDQADPFEKILHPEDRERMNILISEALESGQDFNFEHRIVTGKGETRWVRVQGSMATDSVTGLRHMDGVQMDITDLYAAREAAEGSEQTFRQLFESMAEGYWISDLQGVVEMANPAAAKILGYKDVESVIGLNSLEMMRDAKGREAFIAELIEHGRVQNYEMDVDGADGNVITLNFSTRLTGESESLHSESTFRDVTQQKQIDREIREARHAAEQANRAKSTFLANMSHELRTPLNAIIGYSEMMLEEAEDLEEDVFSEDLHKVHSAGTHLLSLINDVLDLSKIEAGRTELFLEDFSVEELVNSVTSSVEPMMAKNGNDLALAISDRNSLLHQDLTKLRQSLLNLLSNAAKFTENGTVTLTAQIEVDNDEQWLTLSVTDTGIGIAADKHEKLFDEFSQADASTTRQYGGTGLGLAISRRFCELMGGNIFLRSAPGKGSTFKIRVPVRLATEAESGVAKSTETAAASLPKDPAKTVLVIDDDPEACEIIARHLTRSGFEAVIAHSGEEGLRLAADIQPCAITLDIMMPEMDGWTVLNALKADAALKDIPVVMVSMLDDKSAGYTLGATSYLTKPVDRDALLDAINKHRTSSNCVLIIEDHVDTRAMMARVVERAGFSVQQAANGREGIEQLQASTPDIILLDLMMPVMDGFDFIVKMRANEQWRELPVVVITAKDLSESEKQFLSGRVQNVLEKGAYTREHLLAMVRSALSDRA